VSPSFSGRMPGFVEPLSDLAPYLVQVVSRAAKKHRSVASALADHAWTTDITSPLTVSIIVQYVQLCQ
jgi:hypothetical protein